MAVLNRKSRIRIVWPGDELDGCAGTIRRRIRTRKTDGGYLSRYVVTLDKPDSRGAKTVHVFENRVEPINGGESR